MSSYIVEHFEFLLYVKRARLRKRKCVTHACKVKENIQNHTLKWILFLKKILLAWKNVNGP